MGEIKKISLIVILALLSLVFIVTSVMVTLNRGKSAKWIARKMKIGGLILSLTAILQACDPAQTAALTDANPPWTCYMVALEPGEKPNQFYLNSPDDSILTLHLERKNTLEGEIKERKSETYSFAVYNHQDTLVQKDDIYAKDGSFNSNEETFKIEIDKSLAEGDYIIRFYAVKKEDQPEWSEQYFNLKIE